MKEEDGQAGMRCTPRALWAGVWGSASALILVACAWLARAPWPNGTELDAYQPAPLRWPGWLGSFPPPSAAPAPKMRRTAAVGVPKDWRDNINYGYHPDEAKVPEDEEQEAMQALLGAAGGGSVLPAGDVLGKAQHQTRRSARVPQARVAASAGATEQLVKVLAPCEDMPGQPCAVFDVPPKKPRGVGLQQLPQTSQYPCESHPSDLRCSEYPAGQLTPEFDKAKFGRGEYGIKVTNGAIRNVEGNAADTDGRRRSAPESQFQYTMRSLSSKYENQEPAQRRDGVACVQACPRFSRTAHRVRMLGMLECVRLRVASMPY